jgi:cysteine dioxygenase type I
MTHDSRFRETQWLQSVLQTLKEGRAPASLDDLERLRDRLLPLVWADGAPRASTFITDGEADRFRRHPLASIDALGCSALLMYWPPGHATLPHDHNGLWGIEIVLDGALSVNEFVRIGAIEKPTLAPARSLQLGVGDAAVFRSSDYVHRCRNLSNVSPTLTLHVYGGALDEYNAYKPDQAWQYIWSRQVARNDSMLS